MCERRKRRNLRKALVQFKKLAMLVTSEKPKGRVRLRIVQIQHDILWTYLTESLVVRLKGLSKLVLFVACLKSSEVMSEARRVPEACRSNRNQPRQLQVGRGCSIDRDGRGAGRRQGSLVPVVGEKWNSQRVTRMCNAAGQQRLRAVEERLAPAASSARAEGAQEVQASLARVEVAQESRDEELA